MTNSSKAFISILGTVRHTKIVPFIENGTIKNRFENKDESDKALYGFNEGLDFRLKNKNHFNMFPLVLENFPEYEHVPIYTNLSREIQHDLLQHEEISFDIEKNGIFVSEKVGENEAEYGYFLNQINHIIDKYEYVIIDMTHGFRHFPILAIIDLIMQNIQNPDKIEYIFFAKEIEQNKQYEIIDLIEYLELANLSYLLSSFSQNYTVSNTIRFKNPLYANIAQLLNSFSEHFLSNSLKSLIEGTLIDTIINELIFLKEQESVEHFEDYIDEIIIHLEEIKNLQKLGEWQKLYSLSKMMNTRGYQLNAITLLFEAIGFYCADAIETYSPMIKTHIERFKAFIVEGKKPVYEYSTYALSNQSRNIVKLTKQFYGDFLYNPEILEWSTSAIRKAKKKKVLPRVMSKSIKTEIVDRVLKIDTEKLNNFQEFIKEMERLRNNLAHGNSSDMQDDAKEAYQKNLEKFTFFCIEKDILNTQTNK